MRSNLLSLQNIAGQVDLTQNRLSTGLKVNSAIDNPSSYYTAVSLNNRASDLSALLDSMAQGIQTIKAATEGLEAGAALLEQASATATQALETVNVPAKSWFEQQEGVAAVVSSKEELLAAIDSGKKGDIVIYGQIDMGNTTIALKEGQNLTGIGTYGVADNERGKFSALNFEVNSTIRMPMLKTSGNISDLSIHAMGEKEGNRAIIVELNRNVAEFVLANVDIYADVSSNYYNNPLISMGQDQIIHVSGRNNFAYVNTENAMTSIFEGGKIVTAAETVMNLKNDGFAFYGGFAEFNDSVITVKKGSFAAGEIVCNGKTQLNGYVPAGRSTLILNDQSRVDNANAVYNDGKLIINSAEATINFKTSQMYGMFLQSTCQIQAVAGSKISLAGQVYQTETAVDFTIEGEGVRGTPAEYQKCEGETYTQPDLTWVEALSLPQRYESHGEDSQYKEIIKQYDSLIKDSSYKGINLLREQDLTVTFNENRSAQLSVQGKNASAKALGLVTVDWQNQSDVAQSLSEIAAALNQIRQMSSELGNYYSIVTTRENFTQNLINVLTEGADRLTLADMNEESANMLALQTRQQLAVNSLSLASQASQSILKLF